VSQRAPDRRRDVRFEVVGALWGTLVTSVCVRVCDVSGGGLLVESPRELPLGSGYQVRIAVGRASVHVPVRVCHCRCLEAAEGGARFLVGLDFVHVPPEAAEWLDELRREAGPAIDATGHAEETDT